MKAIEVTDLGPIRELSIPVPEQGGLVVLRGGQGVGKSTALKAVSKALGGSVKDLSARDGSRRGVLEFGDVRMTVTRGRSLRKGELEVAELESRLDISALVDPGIEDPERADVKRIKALVALAGVAADPAAYYDLVGGRESFEQLAVDTETKDPLELAGRVKRALESASRTAERLADTEAGHARACMEQIEGIDLEAPSDAVELQEAYDQARDELSHLEWGRDEAIRDRLERQEAQAALEQAQQNYQGPTALEASEQKIHASDELDAAQDLVTVLEQQLAAAKAKRDVAEAEYRRSCETLEAAQSHESTIAAWKKTLESGAIDGPSEEEIEQARLRVQEATEAIEQGVRVRDALQTRARWQGHKQAAQSASKDAERLRDAAQSVDDVLSRLVPSNVLRVEAGRLVLETDRSRSEPFGELSEGERWKCAIDLAAEQLPPHGVLVIPQTAFEGLQPANRKLIHEHAVRRGVTILTAQATDGELEAVEYQG